MGKKSFANSKNKNKRGLGLWDILVHCDGGLSGLCVQPISEKSDRLEPKLSARIYGIVWEDKVSKQP